MRQPRTPMPIENRAKQFMPFTALKGLPEALAAKEKIVVPKILRTEEMEQELDRQAAEIKKGIILSVIYYHNDEYIKLTGMVAEKSSYCCNPKLYFTLFTRILLMHGIRFTSKQLIQSSSVFFKIILT